MLSTGFIIVTAIGILFMIWILWHLAPQLRYVIGGGFILIGLWKQNLAIIGIGIVLIIWAVKAKP